MITNLSQEPDPRRPHAGRPLGRDGAAPGGCCARPATSPRSATTRRPVRRATRPVRSCRPCPRCSSSSTSSPRC
ncbi:hypothetical protein [Nocardioides convexus]|uniref:hypothetical protein n=1 Tax=Nocardioides convexus TaxID=2712224 RepID=UPI003101883E